MWTDDERARRLRAADVDVWLDRWSTVPGDSIPGSIGDAFDTTDACLILLSPSYVKGNWTTKEMRVAEGYLVIPVIIRQCEIPPLLRELVYVDLTSPDPHDDQRAFQRLMQAIDAIRDTTRRAPSGLSGGSS